MPLESMSRATWRKWLAEFLGSIFLTAIVVGSGIAAQKMSPHEFGLELFENAAVTAAGLSAIILVFQPISGAHFNPLVTFVDAAFKNRSWKEAWSYAPFQFAGCAVGAIAANAMFSQATFELSTKHRATSAHLFAESLATVGLLLVIFSLTRTGRGHAVPSAVGAYVGAAYFFTSSTSFANPAITVGRMLSNSFTGIEPASVPFYVLAQCLGAVVAWALLYTLFLRPHE